MRSVTPRNIAKIALKFFIFRLNKLRYAVFILDEHTNRIIQDYSQFRYFLSNLSFRDQVISLCLLSTSQDIGDLLKLKIEFMKNKVTDKDSGDESINVHLNTGFKQNDDKKKIEFFVMYKVPSIESNNIVIDAEFMGLITLKESFDLDALSEETESSSNTVTTELVPPIFKEVNNILMPLFKSMGVKYNPLALDKN